MTGAQMLLLTIGLPFIGAIGYMRGHHEINQTRFYAMFAIAIGSTVGAAFAGNLFTLFLCYEILTISTYPLVAHAGTPEVRRGARTYVGILLATSIGLQLLAILITFAITGTLEFREGGILATIRWHVEQMVPGHGRGRDRPLAAAAPHKGSEPLLSHLIPNQR
jgi:formate hydrogenlyase subunit 3/multisubunit Na+/H+ antiporter MnhD subunit